MRRARVLRSGAACLLTVVALLATTVGPASGSHNGAYPHDLPNFAHPDSPHYPFYAPWNGNNDRPILIIYTRFSDHPLPAGKGAAWLSDRFFGPRPSLAHYFDANSFGRLNLSPANESFGGEGPLGSAGDGVIVVDGGHSSSFLPPPRQPGQTDDQYNSIVLANDSNQNRLALERANQHVNYAQFDRNGDNNISRDELTIFHVHAPFNDDDWGAAARGVAGGDPLDGMNFNGQSVAQGSSHTNLISFAHEMMHAGLGLDKDWYQYKMEHFDIMGETLGANEEFYGVNAWNKMHLGWITPHVVVRDGFYNVDRADRNAEAYILYDPQKGPENYFIVENRFRDATTYDSDVGDSGLAIWRIDETQYHNDQASALPIWLTRPCWGDPNSGEGGVEGVCPEGWYFDIWDPSDPTTPRRTMAADWRDGSDARLAVRAIGDSGPRMRAFFDVVGPGIMIDCYDTPPVVYPGETNPFPVRVRNTMEWSPDVSGETFRFQGANLPAGWSTGSPTRFLAPASSSQVDLNLRIPQDTPDGPAHVRLDATSTTGPSVFSSCPKSVTVRTFPSSLQYLGARSASTGGGLFFEASVRNGAGTQPLPGRRVRFTLRGDGRTVTAEAFTDRFGVARTSRRNPLPEGEYTLTVRAPASGRWRMVETELPFTVNWGPVVKTFVCLPGLCGPKFINPWDPVSLTGTVRPSEVGDLIRFSYRRLGTTKWRPIGDSGGKVQTFETPRNRPLDRLNGKDEFSIRVNGTRPGFYILRSIFVRQDGVPRSFGETLIEVRDPEKG